MIKLRVNCPLCNQNVEITLDDDVAKKQEYFPFEYLNIHGCPEHAMMLYIDESLTVRESVVYEEIDIAQSKMPGQEEELEEEQLCAICLMEVIPGIDEVELCPNKHVVHKECLAQWLGHSPICPKCNSKFPQALIEKYC